MSGADPNDGTGRDSDVDGNVDPASDAARTAPLVVETETGGRWIWASGWYRVRPRIFVQHELFFDEERLSCVYADQSYKSYLLRRDGRDREAARIGRAYLDRPPAEMIDRERSFGFPIEDVREIRIRSGSLLFKPKLVIETTDRSVEFYHGRRSQDTAALAETLRTQYDVDVVEK